MPSAQGFRPDWASAPGDTIADVLRERRLSVAEFAQRIGRAPDAVHDLLQGRAAITLDIARQLSGVLGGSVEFWMSRDFRYQEDNARLDEEWIAGLPAEDMVKFGWISRATDDQERMATLLDFFKAPTVGAVREAYSAVREMVAFRASPAFKSRPAAVAAWLRQGEVQAERVSCRPWSADRFRHSLSELRTLTRQKDPKSFVPPLEMLCADAGVALAIVRAPDGCRASGATRFLSRDKALLLLSFRYLTDDQFWFSFFHEAGHLLLHGEQGFFLEGSEGPGTAAEQEANDFAARMLIPPESQEALLRLPLDARAVIRFAVHRDVSPGIVVGQLQHLKRIGHNQLNRLKRRYNWESEK